jgi:hypothetical protein
MEGIPGDFFTAKGSMANALWDMGNELNLVFDLLL